MASTPAPSPVAVGALIISMVSLMRTSRATSAARTRLQHVAIIGMIIYATELLSPWARVDVLQNILGSRYGPRGPYGLIKSNALEIMLVHKSDRWFRQFFRCSRISFHRLARLIENHPVFVSTGKKPQRPPWYQLAVYLHHFGAANRHHLDTARECHVAAGSVYLYVDRVILAIRSLGPQYVIWPIGERLVEVKDAFADWGFPGALGSVDGSLIRLVTTPLVDAITYYCRKKFYGINVTAVVDHLGRFTFYDIGWPASQNDISVWKRCAIWIKRWFYFALGEYVLADKGYTSTLQTVRPYSDKELKTGSRRQQAARRKFNKALSHARIGVEHVFGLLKGRFPALKFLSGRDMKRIYLSVESLVILHNIFVDFGDSAEEICDFNADDLEAQQAGNGMNGGGDDDGDIGPLRPAQVRRRERQNQETKRGRKEAGIAFREQLCTYMV